MTKLNQFRKYRTALPIAAGFVLLLLAPAPARASRNLSAADPLPAKEAKARLKQAEKVLRNKKRATRDDLRAALQELAEAHARAGGTAQEQATFRRKAEAQLLKGLALYKEERGTPDVNVRTATNILAAKLLGKTAAILSRKEARSLSTRMCGLIEDFADDRKPAQWQQEPLDAAYAALAALNDPATLRWMLEEHSHSKDREMPFLIAAHQAMPKFENVPGALRYEICKRMITAYRGVESVAKTAGSTAKDQAKKRFWDHMRVYVIPVLQHFAGKPENDRGVALSTVREFGLWFHEHHKVRKAPWTDG